MSSQAFELAGSQLKIGNVQIIYRRRNPGEQRSPSPRGGRRNHRAAGRPEIARACGRPRAPPSSSMPASSPAAVSRSRSTARPVSDRPLYGDNAREEVARIIEYDDVWAANRAALGIVAIKPTRRGYRSKRAGRASAESQTNSSRKARVLGGRGRVGPCEAR
jgi:hypothetical protein